jgi:uncharacterized protein YbaP (TraB family)
MKKICSMLLLLMAAVTMQAQLLWKISGNGLQKPSYIIGTYHLAPVSFTDSIKGLKAALDASEQVYGEIVMADLTSPENQQKAQAAMMLPDGQTLDKLFTADEMTRINALVKSVLGVDMTNPMVAQQLGKLTPYALQVQLGVLIYLKKHPGFNPNEGFDSYFQKEAAAKGKGVGGLETFDFQINTLYKSVTMERQKQLLLCMADNLEFTEEQTENVVKAFFTQDIDGIEKAMDAKLNNTCDGTPEEKETLIYSRNDNWMKQMPEIMKQKGTFFAVGAGHLPGERGLLAQLKKAGYTVEGIK